MLNPRNSHQVDAYKQNRKVFDTYANVIVEGHPSQSQEAAASDCAVTLADEKRGAARPYRLDNS